MLNFSPRENEIHGQYKTLRTDLENNKFDMNLNIGENHDNTNQQLVSRRHLNNFF